jgi:4-diphosphocytidyl-2-C-methyl-D-erythritol kinase
LKDSIRAYAKVNLHLEVINKRDDGYHNIFSLMANVDFHDLLKLDVMEFSDVPGRQSVITLRKAGGTHASVMDDIPQEKNLVSRAADIYLKKAGMSGNLVFNIEKNIPAGAGLGGGSSDAAAALKMLNRRFNKFSDTELLGMGRELGADVPYCLTGGFALCKGIGDIVEKIKGNFPYYILIVNNGIHVDTAGAYKSLNKDSVPSLSMEEIQRKEKIIKKAIENETTPDMWEVLSNDFEKPVFALHEELKKIKNALYDKGADFAMMTGSGSSLIGLFKDREKALKAKKEFNDSIDQVYLAEFIF